MRRSPSRAACAITADRPRWRGQASVSISALRISKVIVVCHVHLALNLHAIPRAPRAVGCGLQQCALLTSLPPRGRRPSGTSRAHRRCNDAGELPSVQAWPRSSVSAPRASRYRARRSARSRGADQQPPQQSRCRALGLIRRLDGREKELISEVIALSIGGHATCAVICPLLPLKQTFVSALSMSAACQKRTLAHEARGLPCAKSSLTEHEQYN